MVQRLRVMLPVVTLGTSGQDSKPHTNTDYDNDSGKGTMTSSYGSSASLNSSSSNLAQSTTDITDSPEQFEVLKQQKEIWETGIDM